MILSLFDYSGNWSRPYREAGYHVLQVDLDLGWDLSSDYDVERLKGILSFYNVRGVLAAPPCTDFSASGAQYWKKKDADGRTEASVKLVRTTLGLIEFCKPAWWALENPVGRISKLVPELGDPFYFQPYWYGDAYTKKTGLWGTFNRELPRTEVPPVKACAAGSWLMTLPGRGKDTKRLRSMTPMGFARAFFAANP